MTDDRWKKYLDPKRFRERTTFSKSDGRDAFENDYSRLISSAPIRRLQDKTQVFPLENSDFIRTRLTHSLEVSSIARSIGKSIEVKLEDKIPKDLFGQIPSLLATAGLIHDLGNPPFGHFGEVAIQQFFRKFFESGNLTLSDQEKKDFIYFDGNAQTFRILRRLYFLVDENGYNLSFPLLSTIIKYPGSSISGNIPKEHRAHIKYKKFGHFVTEEKDYKIIDSHLGLNSNRHPLTYILEASDDIAYMAADIEDGVKLGIITFDIIRDVFDSLTDKHLIEMLDKDYESLKNTDVDRVNIAIQRFRIMTQRLLIESIIEEFVEHYDSIMNGSYPHELLTNCKLSEIKECFGKLLAVILKHKKIINIELAGWNVVQGLLKEYIPACLTDEFKKGSKTREGRLYLTVSSSYRYLFENFTPYPNNIYNRLRLIVDFISGMTDNYALQLYQGLSGIRI
ncbi:MAG: dNTP triphosphohydrolase [Bacteroidetes bacterium]|nr:MAG: dNTP triphosphohydrolase [Bacteroidota bacterium]